MNRRQRKARLLLCTEGKAVIKDPATGAELYLKRGVSVFVPAAVRQYEINGIANIYKAFVPV